MLFYIEGNTVVLVHGATATMVLVHGIHKEDPENATGRRGPRSPTNEGGDMTRGKDELRELLEELGEWEDVLALARKRMIVGDLRAAMKARKVSPSEMARRMGTSRQAVYRLLDPDEPSATLDTLARASAALNLDLEVRLVPRKRPKRAPLRRTTRGNATKAA